MTILMIDPAIPLTSRWHLAAKLTYRVSGQSNLAAPGTRRACCQHRITHAHIKICSPHQFRHIKEHGRSTHPASGWRARINAPFELRLNTISCRELGEGLRQHELLPLADRDESGFSC